MNLEDAKRLVDSWRPLVVDDWIEYEPRSFGYFKKHVIPMQIAFGIYLKEHYKDLGLNTEKFVVNGRVLENEYDPKGMEFDLLGFSDDGPIIFECKSIKPIQEFANTRKNENILLGISQAKEFVSKGFPTYLVHAFNPREVNKDIYLEIVERIWPLEGVGYVLFSGKEAIVVKPIASLKFKGESAKQSLAGSN